MPEMGWRIYIVGPVSGFPIKVGYSRNVAARFAALQSAAWDELTIFKTFLVENKGQAIRMERMIHKDLDLMKGTKWKDRTVRKAGEWFNVFADDAIGVAEKAFAYQKKVAALMYKEKWQDEKSSFYGYIGVRGFQSRTQERKPVRASRPTRKSGDA